MKLSARILATLLTVCMLVMMVPAVAINAGTGVVFSVGTAEVEQGESEVTVDVCIDENPGFCEGYLDVAYNKTYFTPKVYTPAGTDFNESVINEGAEDGTIEIALLDSKGTVRNPIYEDSTYTGTVISITFTVADGTPTGEYPLTATVSDGAGGASTEVLLADAEADPVAASATSGKIKVVAVPYEGLTLVLKAAAGSYSAGSTVNVDAVLYNIPETGLTQYQFYLTYDTDVFTLNTVTVPASIEGKTNYGTSATATALATGSFGTEKIYGPKATLATYTFTVKEDVYTDNYTIDEVLNEKTTFAYKDFTESKTGVTVEYENRSATAPATVAVTGKTACVVTWNINGATTTEKYDEGDVASYKGTTPTKDSTAQYTYEFDGWDKELTPLTGDITYTAQFKETLRKYTITFLDDDGTTVLATKDVEYGTTPSYGSTPTKTATAQYTYTFSNWTPALAPVTGEATYQATYSSDVNSYLVSFVDEDGSTVLWSKTYEYGETPVYGGTTPSKAETATEYYSFDGWDKEISSVTGVTTYTAVYTAHEIKMITVTWIVDGETADSTTIDSRNSANPPAYGGSAPTKEQDEQYTYAFEGWEKSTDEDDNIIFTATFTPTLRQYTITWVIDDDTTPETYDYGETPEYPGIVPSKPSDVQYHYDFGWDSEITTVTGDKTYTGSFTPVLNKYVITWLVGGDKYDEEYEYGQTPTFKGETVKESDVEFDYSFTGWDKTIVEVTGDETYTAQFDPSTRFYTVTWDINGRTRTTSLAYGSTTTYEGEEPTKDADAQYTYTFKGWDKELTEVTGDVTYTAQFEGTLNEYTVTWVVDGKTTTETYKYGETPSFKGEAPTKEADNVNTYTFNGWDPAITSVTGDATYTATFKTSPKTGDVISTVLLAVALIGSATVITTAVVTKKKANG